MDKKVRVTKQFKFETGHALYGYDGLCKNVHGHSYKLDVTVIGQPIADPQHVKNGMVIDFGGFGYWLLLQYRRVNWLTCRSANRSSWPEMVHDRWRSYVGARHHESWSY